MAKVQKYPHVAARIFDTPLLIEQSKLVSILNVLGPRLDFEPPLATELLEYEKPEAHLDALLKMQADFERAPEGYFRGSGVAVVPIVGTLVQRSDMFTDISGMMSYSKIESMFAAAVDDPMVNEILLEIDSPGGEVAGAFDTAERMARARGTKPITAIASELSASAAYLLASVADEIVVPRTGAVGSVGVVAAHFDYSRAMDKRGIAVTYVYAGEKKIEGNRFQPLSDSALADWGEKIQEVYSIFVDAVSRNRNMSTDRVRGTQAGMFMGFKAVDSGLADRVNSFSNELNNAVLRKQKPNPGGQFRYGKLQQQENLMDPKAPEPAATQEKVVTAPEPAPATAAAPAPSVAAAAPEGASEAEHRTRIKTILECSEAQGREELAKHLAFETNTSAEDAKAILAKSNKRSSLSAAMDKIGGGPGIRAEEVHEHGAQSGKPSIAESVYKHRREVVATSTGTKLRQHVS